jgi:hypothetical protein
MSHIVPPEPRAYVNPADAHGDPRVRSTSGYTGYS